MDIDDTENPFDTGAVNPGYDETGEMNEMDRFPSSSSRRGSEDTTYHRTHGETSFIEGIDEHTPLIRKENELNDSVDEIKRKFPNADTSKFISEIDEYGRVKVKLIREGGKDHLLFNSDGEVNEKLPKKIIKALGTPAEDIIITKEEEISRRENKIKELQASRETASENQREQIDANIEEQQNEINTTYLLLNVSVLNLVSPQTPIFGLQEATIMASGVFLNISPTQVTPKHLSNIHPRRRSLQTKGVVLLMGILFLISKTQKRETSMNISCVLSRTASQVLA